MLPALGKTLPALETHRADFRSGPSCDEQRQNDPSDDNNTADPGARSYRCSVARQLGRLQRARSRRRSRSSALSAAARFIALTQT